MNTFDNLSFAPTALMTNQIISATINHKNTKIQFNEDNTRVFWKFFYFCCLARSDIYNETPIGGALGHIMDLKIPGTQPFATFAQIMRFNLKRCIVCGCAVALISTCYTFGGRILQKFRRNTITKLSLSPTSLA